MYQPTAVLQLVEAYRTVHGVQCVPLQALAAVTAEYGV